MIRKLGQQNFANEGGDGGEAGGGDGKQFISIADEVADIQPGGGASGGGDAGAGDGGDGGEGDAGGGDAGGGDAGGAGGGGTPTGVFNQFQTLVTENSPDFEIPQDIIDGDATAQLDFMAKTFTAIGKAQASEDPFIKEYTEAIAGGATKEDFLKNYTSVEAELSLGSKEFMTQHLKRKNGVTDENPNGWSDDEISEYIDGMTRVDLDTKVEALKDARRKEASADVKNLGAKNQLKTADQIKAKNEAVKKESDVLFTEMATIKDIGGIPHTKEMQDRFRPVFDSLTEVNSKGQTAIRELLADNKNLYKALFLMEAEKQGLFTTANSEFKQKFQSDFLNKKVRVNPRPEEGQGGSVAIPSPEDMV